MGVTTATMLATNTSTNDCLEQNCCKITVHGVNNPDVPEEEQQNWTRHYLFNYTNLQQFYLITKIVTGLTKSDNILQSANIGQ